MSDAGIPGADASADPLAAAPPEQGAPLRSSPWEFQYRVLKALILRDLVSRYAEYRMGFLLSILLPLATLGILMVIFQLRGKVVPANFSVPVFLVTGYPLWFGFQGVYQRVVATAVRSDPLLMFPQITQLDLIYAAVILEMAINSVVYLVMTLIVGIIMRSPPLDFPGVMFCYWGCMWIGAAFGLNMCTVARVAPLVTTFINMVFRFGMWVSGVVFMVSKLPSWTWPYLKWNPILHCVEGARHLWSGSYDPPIYDPTYVVAIGFILTITGLLFERATRRLVGA